MSNSKNVTEDTYNTFIAPQLKLIREDLYEIQASNKEEHQNIVDSINTIMNGNGTIGHKQLTNEWNEFKLSNKTKRDKYFKFVLVTFNVVLACLVGKIFIDNKTIEKLPLIAIEQKD